MLLIAIKPVYTTSVYAERILTCKVGTTLVPPPPDDRLIRRPVVDERSTDPHTLLE